MTLLAVTAAVITYIVINRNNKKSSGHDLLTLWVINTLAVSCVVVFLYLVGFLDEGWAKLLVASLALAFFVYYWKASVSSRVEKMDVIRERYALETVKDIWNTRKYSGEANISYLVWEKRSPDPTPSNPDRVVDSFLFCLCEIASGEQVSVFYLIKFDPQSKSKIFAMREPDESRIYEELGKVAGESALTALQQYRKSVDDAEANLE